VARTGNQSIQEEFAHALEEILVRVILDSSRQTIAVAYSGGMDSSVLLHLAFQYALKNHIRLFAFHIHHGLLNEANEWLQHGKKECERLGIRFEAKRIQVNREDGQGLEAAARKGRYEALGELCVLHKVPVILTAHHQDDQVETMLWHLMRGSGIAGLSGIETARYAEELLGCKDVLLARPLLGIPLSAIKAWAAQHELSYVTDPSNRDTRYTRNAIRHQVIPVMQGVFPGVQNNIARTVQHIQSAQRILDEVAQQDLKRYALDDGLHISCLQELHQDRIENLLRYWLRLNRVNMPSAAWLVQACRQLVQARQDAQIRLDGAGFVLRRYRNRISLQKKPEKKPKKEIPELPLKWKGETEKRIMPWGGTFLFKAAEKGVSADWLRQQDLWIRPYLGSEKLKLAANRPGRNLKMHYQDLGIPAWEREGLPLLYTENNLLFAAGLGVAFQYRGIGIKPFIQIEWQAIDG